MTNEPTETRKPKGGPRFTKPERAEQRVTVLKMWMNGTTYPNIAKHLDVSISTAHKRVQEAIDEMRPHAEFDAYRATQLAELEVSRRQLRLMIASWVVGEDHRIVVDALGSLLKVQEREARLVGLDRVDVPLDELGALSDVELGELVAEWAAESKKEASDG